MLLVITSWSGFSQVTEKKDASEDPKNALFEKERLLGIVLPADYIGKRVEDKYRISPDGENIAFLKLVGEKYQLYLRNVKTNSERPLTKLVEQEVTSVEWVSDESVVYFTTSDMPNTNGMYFSIVDKPGKDVPLSKMGYHGALVKTCGILPGRFFFTSDIRLSGAPDLYVFDLNGNVVSLVSENPGTITSWLVDRKGQVIGGMACQDDHEEFALLDQGVKWKSSMVIKPETQFIPVSFDATGQKLFCISNDGKQRAAAVVFDVDNLKEVSVLHLSEQNEVCQLVINEMNGDAIGALQGAYNKSYKFWNADFTKIFEKMMQKIPKGDFAEVVNMNSNGNILVIKTTSTKHPVEYFMYFADTDILKELGKRSVSPKPEAVVEARSFNVKSRHGYSISAFVTKPVKEKEGGGLVVLLRDEIWSSTHWGYNGEVQYLTSLGYYVLQVDHVGSCGYGSTFQQAGHGQIDGKMIDDIVDVIDAAKKNGSYKGRKVVVMGLGNGGHMALTCVARYPDIFTGCVSMNGYLSAQSYAEFWADQFAGCKKKMVVMHAGMEQNQDLSIMLTRDGMKAIGDKEMMLITGMMDNFSGDASSIEELFKASGFGVRVFSREDEGHTFMKSTNVDLMYREIAQYLSVALRAGKE
ncbi:MAG: prolyl oligopeptidase family serine peptidase [Flavobacteriales bacterium]|nr:prolyl oligopeptidase family serine peptidase [Flavobacteriales bacterium]